MKYTAPHIRAEDRNNRFYLTIDGKEYLVPVAKPFILIQGVGTLPEEITGGPEVVFEVPTDEDSPMFEVPNATRDEIFVHLCREVCADRTPRRLEVPTLKEARAAKWEARPDGIFRRL